MTTEQCPISPVCILLPCLRGPENHEWQPCPHPDALERIRAAEKVLEHYLAIHPMAITDLAEIERERTTMIVDAVCAAVAVLAITGLWLI